MKELRNSNNLTEEEFLEEYKKNVHKYPSIFNTTDNLIFTIGECESNNHRKLSKKVLKLLLIKRKDHPFINQWVLPGGFASQDEDLEVTAERELEEETSLKNIYMEQVRTFGDYKRDPRNRIISTAYMALIDREKVSIKAGSDAEDAKWFDVEIQNIGTEKTNTKDGYIKETTFQINLTTEDINISQTIKEIKTRVNKVKKKKVEVVKRNGLGFDHGLAIFYGVNELKEKVQNTDIIFNLMPELFSIGDLKLAYEAIVDTEIARPTLKRRMKEMLIETEEVKRGGGHHPPKLFKFYPDWDEK